MAKISLKNGKILNELTRKENDRLTEDGFIEFGDVIPFTTKTGTVYIRPRRGGNFDGKGVHLPLIVGHTWEFAIDNEGEKILVLKKT